MAPLPPEALSKKDEETMKVWLENYRPVRQRTVRSKTTKDKAGALPPAVYAKSNPNAVAKICFPADQVDQKPTASSEIRCVRVKFRKRYHCSGTHSCVNCCFQAGGLVRK